MAKKYTIEEFKEMFDNAKKEVLEKTMNDESKQLDEPMAKLMLSMITMSAIADLEKKLFKEEE